MSAVTKAPAVRGPGPRGAAAHWDGLVVICAASNWYVVRAADRHKAERLSAHSPVLDVVRSSPHTWEAAK